MIYRWIKIDIENIRELGTFAIATPQPGNLLSVVKLFLTVNESFARSPVVFWR